jgi:fatty-acyl-CoA synthase
VTTVRDLLLSRADDDATAVLCGATTLSWRALVAEAQARAALLAALRRPGPFHFGVLLENTPEHLCWLYAAALARATFVGVNDTRRGEALAGDIRHTDCQLLVTDTDHAGLVTGLDLDLPDGRVLRTDEAGYRGLLDAHRDDEPDVGAAEPTDRFLLIFTSGSTGAPKAVVCSTGRFARIARTSASGFRIAAGDVLYEAMPLFHGNALMANIGPALAAGATVALRPRFSASGFLDDVRTYGATYFNYVGRSLAYILATGRRPDDADNPLRLGFGTEASSRDRDEFAARFGCRVVENYGSSEGVVATVRPRGTPAESIGLPMGSHSDVAVVDSVTGSECDRALFDVGGRLTNPGAAIGEIVDRAGGAAFEGYYRNDDADRDRVRGGWFYSGDLGYQDRDGYLYFAGRSGDWLRVDSENFAAAPIEAILSRYRDALMAAVYPVPDPRTGDQVMAAVELRGGAPFDPAAFADFLAAQPDLGTKWAPTFVRVIASMPLTGTNKVLKTSLRREGWHTDDPVWWRPDSTLAYEPLTAETRAALRAEFAAADRERLLATPS